MAGSNGVASRETRESVVGFVAMTAAAVVAALLQWHQAAIWVAGFGAFWAGVLAWIVAVERRLPWPFGPRAPASRSSWTDYLSVVLMVGVFTFTPWPYSTYVSPSTGLGSPLPGFEGVVNVIRVPANAAATLIAGVGLFVIVRSVAEAIRRRAIARAQ